MISSMYQTISALQAYGKKMTVVSNNVANVNSDGYKKSSAILMEGAAGRSVTVDIRKSDQPGAQVTESSGETRELSNVDLAEEFPQTMITQRGYEANLKMVRTVDEMLGSLLDIFA